MVKTKILKYKILQKKISLLFFQVIENLFYTIYNDKQVNVIHSYIYGVPLSDKIPQPVNKEGKVLEPDTPEELWNAIMILR